MEYNSAIIVESLSDADIGYSGLLKNHEVFETSKSEYEIPSRYFVDSLTMMAINPLNSYIYWEVTDETLQKFGIPSNDVKINISIVDENNSEISFFESVFSVGNYYFHHEPKYKFLIAKLNLKADDNRLIPILESNRLKLFDATLKGYNNSPLYGEFTAEDKDIQEGDEVVHLNSMSLLKNKNLSSQTLLSKGY